MGVITRFEDIEAWKTAQELTFIIYSLTKNKGFAKDFGLKDQIRRAAVSAMSNIAEGFESKTDKIFSRYIAIAKASTAEVRSQLYVALKEGYICQEEFDSAYKCGDKAARQSHQLMKYLDAS